LFFAFISDYNPILLSFVSISLNVTFTGVTLNRKDFKRLHRSLPDHGGIIICTDDGDRLALAERIHAAILGEEILLGKLVSVVRPMK
jgi:hypothetical protein